MLTLLHKSLKQRNKQKSQQTLLHQAWSPRPQALPAHQNDEPHELGVRALPTLAGNDVPLLGGADDDLSSADFLLAQLVVTSQFCNSDAIGGQALGGGEARQAKMLQGGLATTLWEV